MEPMPPARFFADVVSSKYGVTPAIGFPCCVMCSKRLEPYGVADVQTAD